MDTSGTSRRKLHCNTTRMLSRLPKPRLEVLYDPTVSVLTVCSTSPSDVYARSLVHTLRTLVDRMNAFAFCTPLDPIVPMDTEHGSVPVTPAVAEVLHQMEVHSVHMNDTQPLRDELIDRGSDPESKCASDRSVCADASEPPFPPCDEWTCRVCERPVSPGHMICHVCRQQQARCFDCLSTIWNGEETLVRDGRTLCWSCLAQYQGEEGNRVSRFW